MPLQLMPLQLFPHIKPIEADRRGFAVLLRLDRHKHEGAFVRAMGRRALCQLSEVSRT